MVNNEIENVLTQEMTSNHFKDWEQVKNTKQLAGIMEGRYARHMRKEKNVKYMNIYLPTHTRN